VRLARDVQTELVRQLGLRYETVRDLGAKVARSQGFTVSEQRLELYGICRDCARLDGRRATGGSRAVQGHAQPRSAP